MALPGKAGPLVLRAGLLAENLGLLGRELAVGEDALTVQPAKLIQQADALRLTGLACRDRPAGEVDRGGRDARRGRDGRGGRAGAGDRPRRPAALAVLADVDRDPAVVEPAWR